jgi:hypothetical protein
MNRVSVPGNEQSLVDLTFGRSFVNELSVLQFLSKRITQGQYPSEQTKADKARRTAADNAVTRAAVQRI